LTDELTLEEMRARLQELGLPHGSWDRTRGGKRKSPLVERQKELLGNLVSLLEEQVERDKKRVSELHATLQRLKHGGGV
jgi:hypothetical protein